MSLCVQTVHSTRHTHCYTYTHYVATLTRRQCCRACNTPAHTQHHAVTSVALPTLSPIPQLPKTALYSRPRSGDPLLQVHGPRHARAGVFHLQKGVFHHHSRWCSIQTGCLPALWAPRRPARVTYRTARPPRGELLAAGAGSGDTPLTDPGEAARQRGGCCGWRTKACTHPQQ